MPNPPSSLVAKTHFEEVVLLTGMACLTMVAASSASLLATNLGMHVKAVVYSRALVHIMLTTMVLMERGRRLYLTLLSLVE